MAQTSIGFNGSINAAAWAANAPLLLDGADAIGAPGECVLSPVAGQRQVSISTGRIGGDAIITAFSSAEVMTTPTPTNGQWFLLVLNRVWATSTTSLLWRNGPTTSASAFTLPPDTYPASTTSNPGTNADVPIAWVWASSSTTTLNIFPILLPTPSSYPRRGPAAQRSTVLSPYFPTVAGGAAAYAGWWAQRTYPMWFNSDNGSWQQYLGQYQETLNPGGVVTAGWYPVGLQLNPIPYGTESSMKNGASFTGFGGGVMGYARDTQGQYYRRDDGRTVRLDGDAFSAVAGSVSVGSGTDPATVGTAAATDSVFNSDTSVFYTRTDSVIRVNVTGWYDVAASAMWATAAANERYVEITRNDDYGTAISAPIAASRGNYTNSSAQTSIAGTVYLQAGDYIKLKAWQNSGGPLTLGYRMSATLKRPDNV